MYNIMDDESQYNILLQYNMLLARLASLLFNNFNFQLI